MSYVLRLAMSPIPVVNVEITMEPSAFPIVVGCDNEWGGIEHCENEIRDVRAHDLEQHTLDVLQNENTWSVRTATRGAVTITYTLSPSKRDAMADEETRYYPVLTDRYLHFVRHVGLLAPRDSSGDESRERTIELHWRGFEEAGWNIACSFGTERDVRTRRSFASFLHSVFVAGDYQIIRARNSEGAVTLAIRPETSKFGPFVVDGMPAVMTSATLAPCLSYKESMIEDGEGATRRTIAIPQFEFQANGQSACPAIL